MCVCVCARACVPVCGRTGVCVCLTSFGKFIVMVTPMMAPNNRRFLSMKTRDDCNEMYVCTMTVVSISIASRTDRPCRVNTTDTPNLKRNSS